VKRNYSDLGIRPRAAVAGVRSHGVTMYAVADVALKIGLYGLRRHQHYHHHHLHITGHF